jgi:hypothetical protein
LNNVGVVCGMTPFLYFSGYLGMCHVLVFLLFKGFFVCDVNHMVNFWLRCVTGVL